MKCIVCNETLDDGPVWENCMHLACSDHLLRFFIHARTTGTAYTKGVLEIVLTGTRLSMERERLRA